MKILSLISITMQIVQVVSKLKARFGDPIYLNYFQDLGTVVFQTASKVVNVDLESKELVVYDGIEDTVTQSAL